MKDTTPDTTTYRITYRASGLRAWEGPATDPRDAIESYARALGYPSPEYAALCIDQTEDEWLDDLRITLIEGAALDRERMVAESPTAGHTTTCQCRRCWASGSGLRR